MMTVPDAATYLTISEREVYNLVASGRLVSYRLGPRLTRFKAEDLDAYIRSCRSIGTKQKSGGASVSLASFTEIDTRLLNSFRKAGAVPKLIPMTGRKSQGFSGFGYCFPEIFKGFLSGHPLWIGLTECKRRNDGRSH